MNKKQSTESQKEQVVPLERLDLRGVSSWQQEVERHIPESLEAFLEDVSILLQCAEERQEVGSWDVSAAWLGRAKEDLFYLCRLFDTLSAQDQTIISPADIYRLFK